MRTFVTLVCVALVFMACHQTPPPTAPKIGENPCGDDYVSCTFATGAPDDFCCDQFETCGGGAGVPGCPATSCCDVGVRTVGKDTVMRVQVLHPQLRLTQLGPMHPYVPIGPSSHF